MKNKNLALMLSLAAGSLIVAPAVARAASVHHIHITASAGTEAVKWYARHLGCQPVDGRADAADCGGVEIVFVAQPTLGGTQGTGVNHIGFSYADLEAKMEELEAVGVRGSGVRLQRFEDGSTVRDVPGLFKIAFIFDPWGTRIELVEDPETLGFHHIHLSATDPQATLQWYSDVFGAEKASLKGRLDGLRLGDVWLLVSQHSESRPASTENRAIDHLGFEVEALGRKASKAMTDAGAHFAASPTKPENGRTSAKRGFISGPDAVRIAVVEPNWAGVDGASALVHDVAVASREPYTVPRTPWDTPDLQGVWTGDAAHGIPLERPEDLADTETLTSEEAAARRERGTLGSIWGYEREWRDTTLGYVKSAPSMQVAMVIDPPDGRLPAMTEKGRERVAAAAAARVSYTRRLAEGPEDLTPYVRCITRGLPGMMMPGIYNNGLQIIQSPGFVAVQKEMVHETRVIPTAARPALGPDLKQWLGDSRGHWDGDTLVVETANFNGRASYRGAGESLKLTERYTRVGPETLEYQFTIDDPTIWTQPWTGMFHFVRDDSQYELVEYACHEGNYGMSNILSGARAREREAAAAAAKE